MKKVNVAEKLEIIQDYWNPRITGELNGQQVRLVKIKGEFVFHHHEHEDEMFLVIKGSIKLVFTDQTIEVNEGEFIIVPRGVTHKPIAENEAHLMMFTLATNVNTGNVYNERTLDTEYLRKI